MLEMTVEGVARYPGTFEGVVVVVFRAERGTRRLCLGVCDRHARAAADVVESGGRGSNAPTCGGPRGRRIDRVVGAHLAWQAEGPLGPQIGFSLILDRDGQTMEQSSWLFGVLKAVLRQGAGIRVDERILEALRPPPGEPRWLAGPLGAAAASEPPGPLGAFIEGLGDLDRL